MEQAGSLAGESQASANETQSKTPALACVSVNVCSSACDPCARLHASLDDTILAAWDAAVPVVVGCECSSLVPILGWRDHNIVGARVTAVGGNRPAWCDYSPQGQGIELKNGGVMEQWAAWTISRLRRLPQFRSIPLARVVSW